MVMGGGEIAIRKAINQGEYDIVSKYNTCK